MKKRTRNILIGSGISIFGATAAKALSRFATKILVSTALDRDMPKAMKKRSLYKIKKDETLIAAIKEKGEMLKNSGCETVEITSHDNKRLVGHWHRAENDKRIIIAMHGWRSTWTTDFAGIYDFWHDNGCSVLYAEQRGQNDSEGDYMSFGMIERYDCLDWIKWANDHNENNLPIYLAGVSMGASTVLMASGFDLPENVCGIMADCGFTSAKLIWKHVAENSMHISYNMHSKMIEDICKKKINIGSDDYTTLDAMKKNKVPVLFIHGTDDDFVPIDMTYENYKACIAPKKLFVVPGATHGMSYVVDKDGYQKTVKEFWRENDKAKD